MIVAQTKFTWLWPILLIILVRTVISTIAGTRHWITSCMFMITSIHMVISVCTIGRTAISRITLIVLVARVIKTVEGIRS